MDGEDAPRATEGQAAQVAQRETMAKGQAQVYPAEMSEQDTFGSRLRQARAGAGLTQAALGDAVGVSKFTVSKWESGLHVPKATELAAIGRATRASVDWLLGLGAESTFSFFPQVTHALEARGLVYQFAYASHPSMIVLKVLDEIPRYGWRTDDMLLCTRDAGGLSDGDMILVENVKTGDLQLRELEMSEHGEPLLLSLDRIEPPQVLRPDYNRLVGTVISRQTQLHAAVTELLHLHGDSDGGRDELDTD